LLAVLAVLLAIGFTVGLDVLLVVPLAVLLVGNAVELFAIFVMLAVGFNAVEFVDGVVVRFSILD
jgi:hypothetical protein